MAGLRYYDANIPKAEALARTLALVSAEMPSFRKDAENPHFKSEYISLDSLLAKLREICARHELFLSFGVDLTDTGRVVYITVTTRVTNTHGAWAEADVPMILAKMDPQATGGAITYGKRYGVQALFAISADDDDDGNAATHAGYTKPQATARPVVANNPPRVTTTAPHGTMTVVTVAAAPTGGMVGSAGKPASGPTQPFGKNKDKELRSLTDQDLTGAIGWARGKDAERYKKFIADAEDELEARITADAPGGGPGDDLPF